MMPQLKILEVMKISENDDKTFESEFILCLMMDTK